MAENASSARIQGLRILAVDDEPDILETIVDVLDGATVDCARSYDEATELLSSGESRTPANVKYDLAILDIMGVDGMALLTQTVNQKHSHRDADGPCDESTNPESIDRQRCVVLSAERRARQSRRAHR